ncbi:MAG: hypothetical protein R3261_05310 [Alphaproteobacteria bacterium]|nr:hypothetical protein [Alphaproteobacteria bacterium]
MNIKNLRINEIINIFIPLFLIIMVLVKIMPAQETAQLDEQPVEKEQQTKTDVEEVEGLDLSENVTLSAILLPAPPPLKNPVISNSQTEMTPPSISPIEPAQPTQSVSTATITPLKPVKAASAITPSRLIKPTKPAVQEAKPPVTTSQRQEKPVLVKPLQVQADKAPETSNYIEPIAPKQKELEKPIQIVEKMAENQLAEIDSPIKEFTEFKAQQVALEETIKNKEIDDPRQRAKDIQVSISQQTTVQTGRSLLKMLELGKGPSIQLFWPQSKSAQAALYNHLKSCYGMVSAVLENNQFFTAKQHGVWALNTDRYSGFLRQPTGNLPNHESQEIRSVRQNNSLSNASALVRLFPRAADAILLGGLQKLLGNRYLNSSEITGRYILDQQGLRLTQITSDGKTIEGEIKFNPISRCSSIETAGVT